MARLSVTEIMAQIAATVNQDAAAPTAGGSEWTLWLSFINRSVQEWAESQEWEDLRKTYYPTITGTTQASISLPHDFKGLAGPVKLWGADGLTQGETWPVALPEQVDMYNSEDKYIYIAGNMGDGKYISWHPGTLASGASISVPYFSIPTSLASPAQVPLLGDSQFLVDRVIAYVFEARSDPRFQEQEQKAREKLLQMVERNNMDKYNSYGGSNYVTNATSKQGFRLGRD